MTLLLNSREDFTADNYARAAWQGEAVTFSAAALQRMAECRAAFMHLIDGDPNVTIYGVTTGYGQFARVRLKPEERRDHARKPPVGAYAAFGPPLPERVARGIVFARLANYVEGHAAVTPALAQAVAQLLDGRQLPAVSAMGQGGAGEILGLAPLFSDLAASFDLAELRGYHYHSGVVFDAYCEGVPGAIARGGRYDQVGRAFGRLRPATGFSINLRSLAGAGAVPRRRKPQGRGKVR